MVEPIAIYEDEDITATVDPNQLKRVESELGLTPQPASANKPRDDEYEKLLDQCYRLHGMTATIYWKEHYQYLQDVIDHHTTVNVFEVDKPAAEINHCKSVVGTILEQIEQIKAPVEALNQYVNGFKIGGEAFHTQVSWDAKYGTIVLQKN